MVTEPRSTPPITTDLRRLEHSEQWRSEDEWLPWPYICPRIKRAGPTIFMVHGQGFETVPELRSFVEFVREAFQVARDPHRLDTPKQAWERYVELVTNIPEVRQVSVSEDPEGTTIWTIIRTSQFGKDLRSQVYRAQIEILHASQTPMVKFRLLNLDDLPAANRDHILPRASKTVLEK